MVVEELQLCGLVCSDKLFQEQPAEQTREHANGEEEALATRDPALAVERDAASGYDHVHVRMVRECRAPGRENGQDADARAEVLRIGCDCEHGLGRWPDK